MEQKCGNYQIKLCFEDRVPCFPYTTLDQCKIRCAAYKNCAGFSASNTADRNRTCTFLSR